VTPVEAEKLALAASEGKVQLALRNFNDTEDAFTRGMTIPNLLTSYSGGSAEHKTAAASETTKGRKASGSASATASSSSRHSGAVVELIKGSKVQEVTF
jgi:pilus assembly protein CpaB